MSCCCPLIPEVNCVEFVSPIGVVCGNWKVEGEDAVEHGARGGDARGGSVCACGPTTKCRTTKPGMSVTAVAGGCSPHASRISSACAMPLAHLSGSPDLCIPIASKAPRNNRSTTHRDIALPARLRTWPSLLGKTRSLAHTPCNRNVAVGDSLQPRLTFQSPCGRDRVRQGHRSVGRPHHFSEALQSTM